MVDLKTVTYAKISQKMVNNRDIAGNTEEEEEYETFDYKHFDLFCFMYFMSLVFINDRLRGVKSVLYFIDPCA